MAEIRCISLVQRQVCAVGLGLAVSAIVTQLGHAQTLPPYSVAASQAMPGLGPTGLITLPGQNGAQQAMAGSINNVCPTISQSTIFVTPGQTDLATICKTMTFNALQVQNQSNPVGLPQKLLWS